MVVVPQRRNNNAARRSIVHWETKEQPSCMSFGVLAEYLLSWGVFERFKSMKGPLGLGSMIIGEFSEGLESREDIRGKFKTQKY